MSCLERHGDAVDDGLMSVCWGVPTARDDSHARTRDFSSLHTQIKRRRTHGPRGPHTIYGWVLCVWVAWCAHTHTKSLIRRVQITMPAPAYPHTHKKSKRTTTDEGSNYDARTKRHTHFNPKQRTITVQIWVSTPRYRGYNEGYELPSSPSKHP